jgi:hypothetical protein
MKHSKNKLNEYIQLYLNELEDYGGEGDNLVISEIALSEFKTLLTESEQDVIQLLREAKKDPRPAYRVVYKDFLKYLENI